MDRDHLRATLTLAEGKRRTAYDDKTSMTLKPGRLLLGTPTVGVGRNLLVPMSDAAITFLLNEDIDAVIADLEKHLPIWAMLDPVRQAVLAEMGFQLGLNGLMLFKDTLTAISAGRYEDAAQHMRDTKWFGQCRGRVIRLADQMRTGIIA